MRMFVLGFFAGMMVLLAVFAALDASDFNKEPVQATPAVAIPLPTATQPAAEYAFGCVMTVKTGNAIVYFNRSEEAEIYTQLPAHTPLRMVAAIGGWMQIILNNQLLWIRMDDMDDMPADCEFSLVPLEVTPHPQG